VCIPSVFPPKHLIHQSFLSGLSPALLESLKTYLHILLTSSRYNLDRLWRGQQAEKAWLGAHLDCITPVIFGVGGTDKEATECRGSMSDQLIVFSRGAFVMVCKG